MFSRNLDAVITETSSRLRICTAQHCCRNAAALKAKGNVAGTDRTEELFAVCLNVFFREPDGLNIGSGS